MAFETLATEFAQEALRLETELESTLLGWESADATTKPERVASCKRLLHTLKGNAGLVGAEPLQAALHVMEDWAASLEVTQDIGPLLSAVDVIRQETQEIGEGRTVNASSDAVRALAKGEAPMPSLASLIEENLWVGQGKLDELVAVASELSVHASQLLKSVSRDRSLRATADRVDALIKQLNAVALGLRTVPVRQLFSRFERLVRDEATRQGKKASLVLAGEEVEVDKSVLDRLGSVLGHLIRNAIAHGLERPGERLAQGKSEAGTVVLRAQSHGSRVSVCVEDDGQGLQLEAIARRAKERGLDVSRPAESLIFEPGFSTAALSQHAGRGVGLDAVRREVTRLNGEIDVISSQGKGTAFRMRVPSSLALQRALVFQLGSESFAMPVAAVTEAVRVSPDRVRWVGKGGAIEHRGTLIPLVDGRAFERPASSGHYAIFLGPARRAALLVDALKGQQDFVFQTLDPEVTHASIISGAALTGDGRLVLRVDPELLMANVSTEVRA